MNVRFPSRILTTIYMASTALIASQACIAENITVGINDYCPITCLTNSPEPEGIFIGVLKAAFPSPEYTLSFVSAPFMRTFALAQEGKLTAITGIVKKPNRKLVHPKLFSMDSYACTYTRPESVWRYDPNDLSSLEDVKIGMIRHYTSKSISKKFEKFEHNMVYLNPGKSSVEERLLRMIIGGRVDTGFLPSISARYLIEKYNWQDKLRLSGCGSAIYSETIAFSAAHSKSQFYANKLDQTYLRMRANGEYLKLLESYGSAPTVPYKTKPSGENVEKARNL